jgi:catechol 2,3-dioxygenase-like lactoylglutathione lyase family enzyme
MLFVNDLERMAAFYLEVLGLRPIGRTRQPDWLEFEADGAGFALHAIPAAIACESPSPAPPRESAPCKLVFSVDDLDAERLRLMAAGVTILDRPWGGWDAVDPEGNVLGFRQEPD